MTAVGSLDRAERANLGGFLLGVFLANAGHICGVGEPLCGTYRNPLLSSHNFT